MKCTLALVLLTACGPGTRHVVFSGSFGAGRLDVVGNGQEAGVAYIAEGRLVFQTFDVTGAKQGAVLELLADARELARVSVATTGSDFLACWSVAKRLQCAVPGQPPTLDVVGYSPQVVPSLPGYVVAYATDTGLVVQRLDAGGTAVGPAVETKLERSFPMFAVTGTGFTLAGGDPLRVQQLDAALKPSGFPVQLGFDAPAASAVGESMGWGRGAMAATRKGVALTISVPYGGFSFTVENGQVVRQHKMTGGLMPGLSVAVVDKDGKVAAAWAEDDDPVEVVDDLSDGSATGKGVANADGSGWRGSGRSCSSSTRRIRDPTWAS